MLNFDFYNPTHIAFGKDQLQQLDNLVPKEAKVLITYGGGSAKKTGLLDKVQEELAKSPRAVQEFGGISANPEFATLMKAVEIVRSEKIDFVLAVGGGSVIDGSKFICLAAPADEFVGKESELLKFGFTPVPVASVVPFGTVLTLPATGSEMNCFAVISNKEDKLPVYSPLTFPKFSIVDPTLTYTLPLHQIANGVVDTFVHTLEQYVTFPVDARFQDRTSEGILQTLIEVGPKTIAEPEDYDTRSNMVWAATMALNGLIGAGVPQDWTTHMIGHEITALYGLDHAKSLAIIQPAVWKVRKEQKRQKLLQYAERVWGISKGDADSRIDAAIAKTEDFFQELGLKTRLSDYDIGEEAVERIAASLEKHAMTALSESQDLNLDTSKEIIRTAL